MEVKNKNKLVSLRQKYYLHLGLSQPHSNGTTFEGYISIIKCSKTFSNPTLNVLSQNEEMESTTITYNRDQ